MAFDFNKGSGSSSAGGFTSPFGESPAEKPKSSSAGFSFGGFGSDKSDSSGGQKPAGFHFSDDDRDTDTKGFDFPNQKNKDNRNGRGFSDLPQTLDPSSRQRGLSNRGVRKIDIPRGGGFDASCIPWKLILTFAVILTAVILVIAYWEEIVYVAYNLIAILAVIALLLLIIRWSFRPRR